MSSYDPTMCLILKVLDPQLPYQNGDKSESCVLTEVLSQDGDMKNGVAIISPAVPDIMFNVKVLTHGTLGVEGVEGPLIPMLRCQK